ncbi:hypothetical protein [Pyrofollis japonicus]|uniref:hypothetical protein n=1 Tax=Pyrofollis japonicus TaxID=3060460 RepID=UPI00295AC934|nr:hypothetical protein [Pyrofollis japonicus]
MAGQNAADNGRDDLCSVVLTIAELGIATPEYIAAKLRLPLQRVRAILGFLEAQKWIERVETDASSCPCQRCPLRTICPIARSATSQRITAYRVKKEILDYCKRKLGQEQRQHR